MLAMTISNSFAVGVRVQVMVRVRVVIRSIIYC